MCKLIAVTNRSLCEENFLVRVERIAASSVDGIILREKDLPPEAYQDLAGRVLPLCQHWGTPCFLHSYTETAQKLRVKSIHLPLPALKELDPEMRSEFTDLGASCHSLEDVREAERLGCTYVTLGHIFATDCKPGLPPRGLELLRTVCATATVPVYAIGGISPENAASCRDAGAAGVCVMSGLMRCPSPGTFVEAFRKALR